MNAKMRKKLVVSGGLIVMALIVAFAVVGGGSAAKVVTVSDAVTGDYAEKKLQVSGNVVDNSFSIDENGVLTFQIVDAEGATDDVLSVSYDKGVSATFGNGVTAICTGRLDDAGVLVCSELVTKCPSKYENASGALEVAALLGYGETVLDKPVKVTGAVKAGSLGAATDAVRLVLVDADGVTELPVSYTGALSDEVVDGAPLVVTGSLGANGVLTATDIALEA